MPSDCPECFGKRSQCDKTSRCNSCEFLASCRYCSENDSESCNRSLGHVCYEKYSYSEEIASPARQAEPEPEIDDPARKIMEFLLDIDNYTAELLSEVLHGNCNTTSDLAKRFGVSRQAIHRKIVDACTTYPNLRTLFITRLYRCRRLMRDSKRLTEQNNAKKNPDQMEFNF